MFSFVAVFGIMICAVNQVATTCHEYNLGIDINNQNYQTDYPDGAFKSSTQSSYGYRAARCRLNTAYEGTSDKKGGWLAAGDDTTPWVEVKLPSSKEITGVITQGRQCGDNWVKSYQVQYKTDTGNNFYDVTDPETDYPMDFNGNSDRNTQVTNYLPTTRTARYIRLRPTDWYRKDQGYGASLRFDLIGCSDST